MDQIILDAKMESLRRCLRRIEDKRSAWGGLLEGELDVQDIIVLNLTRAVQLCVDIGSHILSDTDAQAPRTMGDVFTSLEALKIISPATSQQLRKAVGFRNVAVHQYDVINWEMVYAICQSSLADFRRFAAEIAAYNGPA